MDILIASSPKKPSEDITNVQELFSYSYFERIQKLNISKDAPEFKSMRFKGDCVYVICESWSDYLEKNFRDFIDKLDEILKLYSFCLQPKTIELLEQVKNSIFATNTAKLKETASFFAKSNLPVGENYFGWPGIIKHMGEYY